MEESGKIKPSISVIIPTYKRPGALLRSLENLQDQTCDSFEIIVVDNAADKEIRRLVHNFNASAKVPARYVPEPELGLHNARHTGVKESKAGLLFFTDDDATFSTGCLNAYNEVFDKHSEMVAAGGTVRPIWESSPPDWLLSYIGEAKTFPIYSLMEPYETFSCSSNGFFFGVNMAIRKQVFEWTGFHPELVGEKTIGDGESGLNQELIDKGYLIGYVPEALVFHHIPSRRMTIGYLRKWAWHSGGAQMYHRWRSRKRSFLSILKEIVSILLEHFRVWITSFLIRNRRNPSAIDVQFQSSLGWCKLNYVWWMLTDPKVQEALDMKDFCP